MFNSNFSLKRLSTVTTSVVASLFTLGAAGAIAQTQPANSYPTQDVDAFMNSCVSSAVNVGITQSQAESYCSCAIQEIQNQYTYEQFQQLSRQLMQRQTPPELTEIINTCAARTFSGT
jgi:hypothetical protein